MKPISIHMSLLEIVQTVAEGNPGALQVLLRILDQYGIMDGFPVILFADDMNLRGPMLWYAYKHVCGMDLTRLATAIMDGNEESELLAQRVNAGCNDVAPDGYPHRAVRRGASFTR